MGAGVRQGSIFRAVREGLSEKETLDQGIWKKQGGGSRGFVGGKAFQAAFRAQGGQRPEASRTS